MAVFFCFVFWWTLKNGRPWTISFPWKTKEKRFSGLEHFKEEEEKKKRIGRCRRIVKVTLIHILELYAIKSYLIRVLYGAAYRQIHIRHFFSHYSERRKIKKKKTLAFVKVATSNLKTATLGSWDGKKRKEKFFPDIPLNIDKKVS